MKLTPLFLLFFLVLASISCETEIEFNGKVTEPLMVVNSIITADSVVSAQLTASRFFLDSETAFPTIGNATVALYVNGSFVENMSHTGEGNYQSHHVATSGEQIRLQVSASGYPSVFSEEVVPPACNLLGIDTTVIRTALNYIIQTWDDGMGNTHKDTIGTTYSYRHQFKVRFSDPAGEDNFYRLIVRIDESNGGEDRNSSYLNNFDDIVFGNKKDNPDGLFNESAYDNYNIFDDALIDGKTYTLAFTYEQEFDNYGNVPFKMHRSVKAEPTLQKRLMLDLQRISKGYYLYLKSLQALSPDPFLSEPIQVYTNVEGGLGLLGARSQQQRSFMLPQK